MAPRLSVVFRRLFRLGSFPAFWRQADVIQILKDSPSFLYHTQYHSGIILLWNDITLEQRVRWCGTLGF